MVSKCPSRDKILQICSWGCEHRGGLTIHTLSKGSGRVCLTHVSGHLGTWGITEYKLRSHLAKDGHWVGVWEDTWATREGAKVD